MGVTCVMDMKIAICDDEKIVSSKLKSKVYDYSNLHNWESVVDTYECGLDLINSGIKYDIVILDYKMDKLDGLETARLLRSGINKFSCLIFLTSYPEIAISAYDVDTYRFIVKSQDFKGLYEALDAFRNTIKLDYDISIKVDDEHITINTENITFIEVQNKFCFLHLSDGLIFKTKRTLSNLYKELPHTHFFKIHKAYIINFKHIAQRSNTYIKVRNYDYKIPISRNYLPYFKEAYYKYIKDNKV